MAYWKVFGMQKQRNVQVVKEPASRAPIKTIHLRPHSCIPIFMYIHNHLGFIFLGGMGGTWGQGDRV